MHDLFSKRCWVLGCGNPLLGDDGFGPKVIAHLLESFPPMPRVALVDAGTAVRDILFDLLLSPVKPGRLVVVDTGNAPEKKPGDIFEISVDRIVPSKIHDYSLHQFPTTNMLKEIAQETDVKVTILVVQPAKIPDAIEEGLSPPVAATVPRMAGWIHRILQEEGYA